MRGQANSPGLELCHSCQVGLKQLVNRYCGMNVWQDGGLCQGSWVLQRHAGNSWLHSNPLICIVEEGNG